MHFLHTASHLTFHRTFTENRDLPAKARTELSGLHDSPFTQMPAWMTARCVPNMEHCPPTPRKACDLLREACELLRRVRCEFVPAHLQHLQQTMEDTGRGVQVPESVDYLRQLGSDLYTYRKVVKLFQQTQEDTSLCDSVLAPVDFRRHPHSVLSRNNGVTRTRMQQSSSQNNH